LTQAKETIAELDKEVNELQDENIGLKRQVKTANKTIAQLYENLGLGCDSCEKREGEVTALTGKVDELTEEVDNLTGEMKELTWNVGKLNGKVKGLTEALEEKEEILTASNTESNTAINKLTHERNVAREREVAAVEQSRQLSGKIELMEKKLAECYDLVKAEDQDSFRSSISSAERCFTEIQVQKEAIEGELAEVYSQRAVVESNVAQALLHSNTELQMKHAEELTVLRESFASSGDVHQLMEQFSQVVAEKDRAVAEKNQKAAELDEVNVQKALVQGDLQNTKAAHGGLEERLRAHMEHLNKHKERESILEAELSHVQQSYNSAINNLSKTLCKAHNNSKLTEQFIDIVSGFNEYFRKEYKREPYDAEYMLRPEHLDKFEDPQEADIPMVNNIPPPIPDLVEVEAEDPDVANL
jgi:chromosome segregation ATPase